MKSACRSLCRFAITDVIFRAINFLSAYAVNDVNSFEAYKQIGPTLDRDGFECRFLCLAHDPSDRLDCLRLWARQVVALQDTFVLVRLWRAALLRR